MHSQRRIVNICLGLLIVVLAGIVIHAPLIVVVSSLAPSVELLAKGWKEMLLLLVLLLLSFEVSRRKQWQSFFSDRIIQLSAAYALITLVLVAWRFQGTLATIAGLMIDLRYVAMFVAVYVVMRLYPDARKSLLKVAVGGAGLVVGFATLQTILPPGTLLEPLGYGRETIQPYLTVDKNTAFIRQNGTLRGPNPLGAYAGAVLLLLSAFFWQYRQKLTTRQRLMIGGLAGASLIALVVSYSRSAWLGFVVAVGVGSLVLLRQRITRRLWIGIIVGVMALAGGLVVGRENSVISTLFFHDNPTGSQSKSDEERLDTLVNGTKRAFRQPLGAGIGSTGSASLQGEQPFIVENQYLFVAHEVGWVGLGLFIWLFGEIMYRLWKKRSDWLAFGLLLSGISLAMIGFMLPVWADDTVAIVWWGLAAVALGGVHLGHERSRQKSSDQKTA